MGFGSTPMLSAKEDYMSKISMNLDQIKDLYKYICNDITDSRVDEYIKLLWDALEQFDEKIDELQKKVDVLNNTLQY